MQFFGFTALSAFLWLTGGFSRSFAPGWTPWLFAAIAGLINTVSGLALYRSFEVGAISIAGAAERLCPVAERADPALVTFVQNAARAISRDLGAGRW